MTQRPEIALLIETLSSRYKDGYQPYGTSEDEMDGTGFRIQGIAATFSVVCTEDTLSGEFDIQIESSPPGDYLYTDIVSRDQLLALIEAYRKPPDCWPVMDAANS